MRWDERAASWKTGTPLTSGRDGAPGHMTVGTARSGLLHKGSRNTGRCVRTAIARQLLWGYPCVAGAVGDRKESCVVGAVCWLLAL